jgi:phospholipase/carboxylesterase
MPLDLDRTLHLLPREGPATLLFVHLHGAGASALVLTPLAERLARAYPRSAHLLPEPFSPGEIPDAGQPASEIDRVTSIASALRELAVFVAEAQRFFGVAVPTTALAGFAQGGMLALEAAKLEPPIAGRVLAFGARFATLPQSPPAQTVVHLLHGKDDAVVPFRHTVEAATRLVAQGGDVTADVVPGIGHEPHPELIERAVEHLQTYLPRRLWAEALAEAPIWPGKSASGRVPH